MEVPTTSDDNSIDHEMIATIELSDQTSAREYDIKKSEIADSETLSNGSRSSNKSQQSYAQYLEYFTRYASTYALYDRSHYPKPCFKRRRVIIFIIFCSVLGFVGLGIGLEASLSKSNKDISSDTETIENTTTVSPNKLAPSTTPEVLKTDPRWIKPEIMLAFLGVFSSQLARTFDFWTRNDTDNVPINPNSTLNTAANNTRSMERLEITSEHFTVWNSWSECKLDYATNSCLDADSPGEICSFRTRFGSVWIDKNQTSVEVKQESPDECDCVPCPTWGSWSECSPAHNCLDTIISGEICPVRTRSGRVWANGEFIDVKTETSDGCNCEPCTFRLTDWVDGGCTRDAGINGGDGDCPCHWTQYRYCQQLSNGT